MPTGRQILRTMSPKRARHPTPDDDDKSGLERKSSLSRRSNSLRGLRFPRKTHEAPSPSEEENFKREWHMTMEQEVRIVADLVLLPSVLGFCQCEYRSFKDPLCPEILTRFLQLQNDLLKKFRDQLKQEGILSKNTGGRQSIVAPLCPVCSNYLEPQLSTLASSRAGNGKQS